MATLALSLDYIHNLEYSMKIIIHNLRELELIENDIGKANLLDCQISSLHAIVKGLEKITKNPGPFLLK